MAPGLIYNQSGAMNFSCRRCDAHAAERKRPSIIMIEGRRPGSRQFVEILLSPISQAARFVMFIFKGIPTLIVLSLKHGQHSSSRFLT